MTGVIYSANPPRSIVSKGECQVIEQLKKLKDSVILPADKGKATVVLDKEEYMSKVKLMLSDAVRYKNLQNAEKGPDSHIKKDQVKNFTDHLNFIDDTNSVKFTYEEESNGVILFLDLLINRQPDKTVKIQVYCKPTHTDQYLHFRSHHPIHHKSGVVRTLMDRKIRWCLRIEKSYTLGMH